MVEFWVGLCLGIFFMGMSTLYAVSRMEEAQKKAVHMTKLYNDLCREVNEQGCSQECVHKASVHPKKPMSAMDMG